MADSDIQTHVQKHYDDFAKANHESVLASAEPEYWSTGDELYDHLRMRVGSQMALVAQYFSKDEPILDLGCGYGRQAIPMARDGYRVDAADLSPGLLETGRALAAKWGVSVEFRQVNLVSDVLSERHDWKQVCLFDVIEHMPPEQRIVVIKKIADVMAPGGIFLLSLPSRENDSVLVKVAHRLLRFVVTESRLERKEHPYIFPTRRRMEAMLSGAFEVAEWFDRARTLFFVARRR